MVISKYFIIKNIINIKFLTFFGHHIFQHNLKYNTFILSIALQLRLLLITKVSKTLCVYVNEWMPK